MRTPMLIYYTLAILHGLAIISADPDSVKSGDTIVHMGILMLFIVSIMWSFVGVLVKTASASVNSWTITLSRFLFGVMILGLFMLLKKQKLTIHIKPFWIWVGIIGKSCNYLLENIGLSLGHTYGIIIVIPVEAMLLVFISVFFLKERMNLSKWVAVLLCMTGIFFVSWNGNPLDVLFRSELLVTILLVFAGAAAAAHVLSQKMLLDKMDAGSMNFSVFLWCTLLTAIPVPFTFQWKWDFSIRTLLCLVALGFITGISFYMYTKAIMRVSFLAAAIIPNLSSLLSLVWAKLFYNEAITLYITVGSVLFITGLVGLNLPEKRAVAPADSPGV